MRTDYPNKDDGDLFARASSPILKLHPAKFHAVTGVMVLQAETRCEKLNRTHANYLAHDLLRSKGVAFGDVFDGALYTRSCSDVGAIMRKELLSNSSGLLRPYNPNAHFFDDDSAPTCFYVD